MRQILYTTIIIFLAGRVDLAMAQSGDDCQQLPDQDLPIGACTTGAQNSQSYGDDLAREYHNRGATHMSKGEYRQAIPLFVLALRHGPEHQYTYYNRAQIHCRNGYYKGAILELDQALRVDPNFSEAYHFRGLLHFKKGKLEAARSDLNQALRIAPRNGHAELYRDRASLCLRGVDANYCRYMEGFSCDWTLRFARAGKLKGLIPFFGRYHK